LGRRLIGLELSAHLKDSKKLFDTCSERRRHDIADVTLHIHAEMKALDEEKLRPLAEGMMRNAVYFTHYQCILVENLIQNHGGLINRYCHDGNTMKEVGRISLFQIYGMAFPSQTSTSFR
jgi:hypothetical protein